MPQISHCLHWSPVAHSRENLFRTEVLGHVQPSETCSDFGLERDTSENVVPEQENEMEERRKTDQASRKQRWADTKWRGNQQWRQKKKRRGKLRNGKRGSGDKERKRTVISLGFSPLKRMFNEIKPQNFYIVLRIVLENQLLGSYSNLRSKFFW